jgi:hypothetical protein
LTKVIRFIIIEQAVSHGRTIDRGEPEEGDMDTASDQKPKKKLELYSAKGIARELGIPHHEVIRRIRRGEIKARKLDWNWIITGGGLAQARRSQWYQRHLARQNRV